MQEEPGTSTAEFSVGVLRNREVIEKKMSVFIIPKSRDVEKQSVGSDIFFERCEISSDLDTGKPTCLATVMSW